MFYFLHDFYIGTKFVLCHLSIHEWGWGRYTNYYEYIYKHLCMFIFMIFTVPGYVGGGAQVLPVFLLACVPLQVSNVIAAID